MLCPEENKEKGKHMSKTQYRISKLILVIGTIGLMMGLPVTRLSAEVALPLSEANYSGRYICSIRADGGDDTAVIRYKPNGTGSYIAGTYTTGIVSFGIPFDPTHPASEFCNYTLNTTDSHYIIDTHGLGFETLSWTAAVGNNGACPPSFVDQTAIALRNSTNPNDFVLRAEVSDVNLNDEGTDGWGHCLK